MRDVFLSVVVPAYNEGDRLISTLKIINQYLESQKYASEIIVVDDGSKDATAQIVTELKEKISVLRLISYDQNQGKGYAVNQGILSAKGEWLLFCDADDATPFEQIDKLLKYIPKHEVIIGSRHVKGSQIKLKQNWLRRTLARMGNWMVQVMILPGIEDTQCGFKLFHRQAAREIFSRQSIWRWGFDMEILYIARKLKYRVKEVPVDWYDRKGSKLQPSRVFFSTFLELLKIKWRSLTGQYR